MTKRLAAYRAKRDFGRTKEPAGLRPSSGRAKHLRFVVQKHDATRLHYDLRLEWDGVFKSWAVTKGPSLDPSTKRLAVEVEDHPLEYGDFEGTIPQGEYGGGIVMLWDRGFWMPEAGMTATDMLKEGELKFVTAGEKLRGGWVLVRMRNDRSKNTRTNWLLVKHRDGFEKTGDDDGLLKQDRSVASGRTMAAIAAGKAPAPTRFIATSATAFKAKSLWSSTGAAARAPVSKSLSKPVSKPMSKKARAEPEVMPVFIVPQLCKLVAHPPQTDGWVHEIKFDGYRMQLRIDERRVTLRSRTGLDWTAKFPKIARDAGSLGDAIIDGEVVAFNQSDLPDFSALQAALSEGRTENLVFFAFDLLWHRGEDLRREPLSMRKTQLDRLLKSVKGLSLRMVTQFHEPGNTVLTSVRGMDLEGIVSKRLQSRYTSGRGDDWTKTKCRPSQEVVIGGWSGDATTIKSLLAGVYKAGRLEYAGRIGTGFNARNTTILLKKLAALQTDQKPFDVMSTTPAGVHWVRPDLVAEIQFAGWTAAGSIRQAAFKGLRDDKPATDVDQSDTAPAGDVVAGEPNSRKPSEERRASEVMGISISKPEKILWPADGTSAAVTKLDLARYIESVGTWMIQHLKGRPCSTLRAPDGLARLQFFQRHSMPGLSDLVTLTKVRGERSAYLQFDTVDALVAMSQLAVVEYHPWNCQPGEPDVPGRLVFDLDPGPDVPFSATVDAAHELRQRLEQLGLVAFCKTTGGKGLHVVTPLRAKNPCSWEQAKTFARSICSEMALDAPEKYLVTMSKTKRVGRIYLDYLRNDPTATAVAPLSPRARPHATVSKPLTWADVTSRLDPQRFTVHTVPSLLAKSIAWRDYSKSAQSLSAVIKKYAG